MISLGNISEGITFEEYKRWIGWNIGNIYPNPLAFEGVQNFV
jgi:hypothetical protein